ncbi:glyoxylate reductase [Marinobacterium nitratireducens]|uniref:Glyoxylate reductase n=1 Tax=Marinobacterium nitratireducens TaxID=518897 RepID=A0A917Z766_9GAMM|nr:D-2-hydroxyacid dehydrogenase family protein [Marinobacterium nitratireducens]GGO76962.1 glyoxylate reductase [Marinobacterium nitratireducens]
MKVVIPDDYQDVVRTLNCFSLLDAFEVAVYRDACSDIDELARRFAGAQALVLTRERTPIDSRLLARLPDLQLISQTGKIAAHLDLEACTAAGVAVTEGQGSPVAPAELTWALIMAGMRRLLPAIDAMKAGRWQVNIGDCLAGKTLGIWGYGKIGRRIARYAAAFDMKVVVWGSEASRAAAVSDGHSAAENRELFFASVDVLSLHLRLNDATRGLVRFEDLRRMKPDALFVNTSRAELVAPDALRQALQSGRPGRAALDVFEQEPLTDPLHWALQMPQVLCTPHLGYVERQGYELYFGTAFANVVAFFEGRRDAVINPAALGETHG